jgi:predicted secreted hydrolase
MNVRALLALALAAQILAAQVLTTQAAAQPAGFAGLGADASGFALPDPGHALVFPRDHGAHENFRIEWWYLTAALKGADGKRYGAQWTLFRSALAPKSGEGWASPQLWMAHAAVTTPKAHHSAERFARGGIGQAGVTAQPFAAWIDEWEMKGQGEGLDRLRLAARGDAFSYALDAVAQGPLVAHGQGGYSVKSASGQASHYYSQPFYRVSGTLNLPTGPVEVSGEGWLDREWSSQPLDGTQTGWDWIALHLDDGRKLMAARVRGASPFLFGTLIGRDGAARHLTEQTLRLTPQAGTPPTTWRVEVPDAGLDVTLAAVNRDAWMRASVAYWEGPVVVTGSSAGSGYLEMTGYAPPK